MTNPQGRIFISYRRSPGRASGTKEAASLRTALRDRGVPTWRDLEDLSFEPTEGELVEVLKDPHTAGAVMLVTPEVAASPIIRNVEAYRIFKRHAVGDGFFVLPVLVGLNYDEAEAVLGSPAGFQNLGDWNLHKLDRDALTADAAEAVADRIVRRRIELIRKRETERPLTLGLFSRATQARSGYDLRHEVSPYFDGRTAATGAYDAIEKGLVSSAGAVLSAGPDPEIHASGLAALPLGVLFGAVYSPRAGFNVSWRQRLEGHEAEYWSHSLTPAETPSSVRKTTGDVSSEDLVLAVGVSAQIERAVSEALQAQKIDPRASVYIEPASGPLVQGQVMTAEEGLALALQAVSEARAVKDDLGLKRARLHLFLACPLALAMLIGQKLNTFSECVLYEHDPGQTPSYTSVHRFSPSGYVYR